MYDEEKMQPFVDYLLSLIIKYATIQKTQSTESAQRHGNM